MADIPKPKLTKRNTKQIDHKPVHSYKYSHTNQIPKPSRQPPLTTNQVSNILNKIKQSIFVQSNEPSDYYTKYTSNTLLTSPHVSQGLKTKYSQIYLETINQINSNQQQKSNNTNNNNANNNNIAISQKKEEIMSLLKANPINTKPIANYKANRTALTSMRNTPRNRSKKQTNLLKEISTKIGINQYDYIQSTNKLKPNFETEANDDNYKGYIKKRNYSKCYQASVTSDNNNYNNELISKCNPINTNAYIEKSNSKIVKAQSKFEKILNDEHKPIRFSSNYLKKNQRKIHYNNLIKAEIEETQNYLDVLTIKNNNNNNIN